MKIVNGFVGSVGNTPLIRLDYYSKETGCDILGKAEFMNPGGSVKDRAALEIITQAEMSGELRPGGTVVEGTAGNTGIGLAHICNAKDYRCIIVIPETQSPEKLDLLRALGADVRTVPAVPYADENNFQKIAGRLAAEMDNTIWANQFDNRANRSAHYKTTGPELWSQTNGEIDAFVAAVGTGGTLAGTAMYLKEQNDKVKIVLADPNGSALYNYVHEGTPRSEGGGSISEGIGNTRVTQNLEGAPVDDAFRITDEECIETVYTLLHKEGLMLGGSSGINVAAAVQMARKLGPGHTIVTMLCDSGQRYQSRIYNEEWLKEKGLLESKI
ncbi:MAG: cysteine synthase A [bacterium]